MICDNGPTGGPILDFWVPCGALECSFGLIGLFHWCWTNLGWVGTNLDSFGEVLGVCLT